MACCELTKSAVFGAGFSRNACHILSALSDAFLHALSKSHSVKVFVVLVRPYMPSLNATLDEGSVASAGASSAFSSLALAKFLRATARFLTDKSSAPQSADNAALCISLDSDARQFVWRCVRICYWDRCTNGTAGAFDDCRCENALAGSDGEYADDVADRLPANALSFW